MAGVAQVTQRVEVWEDKQKLPRLLEILGEWCAARPESLVRFRDLTCVFLHRYEKGKTLIFVERQEMADALFRDLLRHGYPSLTLHAGKVCHPPALLLLWLTRCWSQDQFDRESTIADYKNGVATILIATSVASRGLDVRDLVLVVNYTAPNHMEVRELRMCASVRVD
jgi:ATP-dependent RNA helicase DDX46/PRP5